MTRPSELPRRGLRDLSDADVPDALESDAVVLLAFLDPNDPACQRLRARLEILAAKMPGAAFGAVDVTRSPLVADALGVKGVPFLVVFQHGAVVDRLIGAPPDAVIEDVLRVRLRPSP